MSNITNINFKILRKNAKLTQKQIAQHLNISSSTYVNYELGISEMPYELLFLLADYYAVSIDYLLGRNEVNHVLLSEKELKLIKYYRLIKDDRQKKVEHLLYNEVARAEAENEIQILIPEGEKRGRTAKNKVLKKENNSNEC